MQPEKLHDHTQQTPIVMTSRSAEFNLDKELEELRNSPEWESGIAHKVLVRYPDFQITLRRMTENTRIPDHQNPSPISVQTVVGHIQMHADGNSLTCPRIRCSCWTEL